MKSTDKQSEQRSRDKRKSGNKLLLQQREKFNTDGHQEPSSRNVGPGYDDTGKGNDARTSRLDEKRTQKRKAGNK
jgi:hypothetical protein